MRRRLASLGVLCAFLASSIVAQRNADIPSVDLVELDAAVVDDHDQPVTGLTQKDFAIKEDGDLVEIRTFSEVTSRSSDTPRSILLLLDDVGVPASGSPVVQKIARAFVRSAAPQDDVAVVRLHNPNDEPFGDRPAAEFRIAEYQANSMAFSDWITPEETLNRVASLSRLLEADEHRRKVVICVGAPAVCNIAEPIDSGARASFWLAWVNALSAAAKSNVAVYALVPGRAILRGGGFVDFTGGEVFATTYDFGPAVERILSDAGNYYMLGYWPSGKSRQLHSLDVKVARKGVRVHARHRRGN